MAKYIGLSGAACSLGVSVMCGPWSGPIAEGCWHRLANVFSYHLFGEFVVIAAVAGKGVVCLGRVRRCVHAGLIVSRIR